MYFWHATSKAAAHKLVTSSYDSCNNIKWQMTSDCFSSMGFNTRLKMWNNKKGQAKISAAVDVESPQR